MFGTPHLRCSNHRHSRGWRQGASDLRNRGRPFRQALEAIGNNPSLYWPFLHRFLVVNTNIFYFDVVVPCQTANWVRPDSGFRNHRPFFTINHVDHKLLEILLQHSPSATTHRFWPPEFGSRTPNLFIQPHSHPHHLLGLLEGWGPISSSFRTVLLQLYDLIFDESALNVTLTNCLRWISFFGWPWPHEGAFHGHRYSAALCSHHVCHLGTSPKVGVVNYQVPNFGKFVGKNGEQGSVPKRTHRDETTKVTVFHFFRIGSCEKWLKKCLEMQVITSNTISSQLRVWPNIDVWDVLFEDTLSLQSTTGWFVVQLIDSENPMLFFLIQFNINYHCCKNRFCLI